MASNESHLHSLLPQLWLALSIQALEQRKPFGIFFFVRSDSIGGRPERGASCVVTRVLLSRRVVRIQLGERPNSSTNSCTETPASALEMICCRCIGVKLGPLGVFPEISVPN